MHLPSRVGRSIIQAVLFNITKTNNGVIHLYELPKLQVPLHHNSCLELLVLKPVRPKLTLHVQYLGILCLLHRHLSLILVGFGARSNLDGRSVSPFNVFLSAFYCCTTVPPFLFPLPFVLNPFFLSLLPTHIRCACPSLSILNIATARVVSPTMTTVHIPASDVDQYDFLIVGGGTAGCVIASRLAEYLPNKRILLIEAGPSDFMDDRVLLLKDWLNLLGGELDYDYPTTEQPMGNSNIRHSRAKVLGGCSSHNTLISFRPFEYDCNLWVQKGCKGWDFKTFTRVLDNLRNTVQPVDERHRNQLCLDWIKSCSDAMNIPVIHDFNKEIREQGALKQGVGFFSVSYNPDTGHRSSASVAYIHPILRGDEKRPNLTILTNAWVSKVNVSGDKVTGINITLKDGTKHTLRAKA